MVENVIENGAAGQRDYDGVAKTLHWLILLLLIAQYTIAWTMPHIGRNTPAEGLVSLHFSIGVTILAIVILRLLWRWTHPMPMLRGIVPLGSTGSPTSRTYCFISCCSFCRSSAGSMRGSAAMRSISSGLFTIPQWIAASPALAGRTGDIHAAIGTILLILVGLHVLGALYHLARRDGVFSRMLPRRKLTASA